MTSPIVAAVGELSLALVDFAGPRHQDPELRAEEPAADGPNRLCLGVSRVKVVPLVEASDGWLVAEG